MLPGVGSQSGASYQNGKHVTDVLFLFSSFSFLFEVGVSRNFPRLVPTSLSADTFHQGTPSSFRTSFSVVITSQAWMANDTYCVPKQELRDNGMRDRANRNSWNWRPLSVCLTSMCVTFAISTCSLFLYRCFSLFVLQTLLNALIICITETLAVDIVIIMWINP